MSKAGKELTKREIVLVDQSAAEVSYLNVFQFFLGVDQYTKHLQCYEKLKLYWKVSLTLWGETAKRFDGSNQPVIAVKATRVRSFVLILL